ncbi:T9SS type A sorting domain-containing protein [Candidatus Marinimicrobia bacterium MT.SAG.4]|nr:T9SS type A sorting domain-containing protein [Candidatus Marinimicrobia bacterium MT.SAG.4]
MKFFSLIIALALFLLLISSELYSQGGKASLIRIQTPFQDALRELTEQGFDIIETKEGIHAEVIAFEFDLKRLEALGISYEVLVPDLTQFYLNRAGDWQSGKTLRIGDGTKMGFFNLDSMYLFLDSLQAAHPTLISEKDSIGQTILGRTQWMYKVSDNPETDEAEPELLFTGLTHARESGGATALLYFIEWLVNSYVAGDSEAVFLVDNREIYFVPVVNPDGLAINDSAAPGGGAFWRKNVRDNDSSGVFEWSNDGVDLNRNFDFMWGPGHGGSSGNPQSAIYRGVSAASEPEIQGLQNFVSNREFSLAFNYHSYGNLLIWPWGYLDSETDDSTLFRELGENLSEFDKYVAGTGGETVRYTVNGASDDYMYGVHGIYSMTPEIGTKVDGFWPNPVRILPQVHQVLHMNKTLAWLAGAFLEVTAFDIDDSSLLDFSDNDSDGWFDPGETVGLILYAKNKGVGVNATGITGTISTNNPLLTLNTSTSNFPDAAILTETDNSGESYSISLDSAAVPGDTLELYVTWRATAAGSYISVDTVRIIIGTPVIVFFDGAEDGTFNWDITGSWGVSDNYSVGGNWAFDDSPNGTPPSNADYAMTLIEGVDLSLANSAFVTFESRWDIEQDYDGTMVEFSSDDGVSWNQIGGRDTYAGVDTVGRSWFRGVQPVGEPIYSGFGNRNWRKQNLDASKFLGADPVNSKLRLRTVTDSQLFTEFDGFYADNIAIGMYTSEKINPLILNVPILEDTKDTTDYAVGAIVSDDGGVALVNLYYSLNDGEYAAIEMNKIDDFRYESAIPGQLTGTIVNYYVEALDNDSNVTTVPVDAPWFSYSFKVDFIIGTEPETQLPKEFSLLQNYPNPFNPQTEIRYELPEAALVRLTVYNLLGQELSTIVDNQQEAGFHTASWFGRNNNGQSLASGVYIYKLTANSPTRSFEQVRKMVLLR